MNDTSLNLQRKILCFAAIVEVGTGLILMIDPAIVVKLLIGSEVSGSATLLGRCFGIALLALGLACWPSGKNAESGSPAVRGMFVYNLLIALFLVYLFKVGHLGGILLWPAVVLHAVVALFLIWSRRTAPRVAQVRS